MPIVLLLMSPDDKEVEEPVRITIHAKQLPKGTYVRLRPLEAGYNPDDWKSLLERHLRENFTTLTNREILTVRGSKSEEFQFLIDKFIPEGNGICVVDTDLEVDIEALNEEQARETVKRILAKAQKAPGTVGGSSVGGDMNIWKASTGQVLVGDYVDYQLPSWDRSQGIEIRLDNAEDLELFISPYSSRQRVRPRDDEHVFGDFSGDVSKRITITATNVELEGAESLYVSVYCRPKPDLQTSGPQTFALKYTPITNNELAQQSVASEAEDGAIHSPDEECCNNCTQWVPKRTMMLHQNFCLRNNVLCPQCQNVFQKKSKEWISHWHCPHDATYGNTLSSKETHDNIFHTPKKCPNCTYEATNLRGLASHRTSICPGKHILCQFCHLEVPQEGDPFNPSPEALQMEHEQRTVISARKLFAYETCPHISNTMNLRSLPVPGPKFAEINIVVEPCTALVRTVTLELGVALVKDQVTTWGYVVSVSALSTLACTILKGKP